MDNFKHLVCNYLIELGSTETLAKYLNMFALLLALIVLVFIVDFVIRKLLIQAFGQIAKRSKTHFDDLLVANKAPRNIAHIAPLLLALEFIPLVLIDFQYYEKIAEKGIKVFGVILTLWIARSILHTIKDYLKTLPNLK